MQDLKSSPRLADSLASVPLTDDSPSVDRHFLRAHPPTSSAGPVVLAMDFATLTELRRVTAVAASTRYGTRLEVPLPLALRLLAALSVLSQTEPGFAQLIREWHAASVRLDLANEVGLLHPTLATVTDEIKAAVQSYNRAHSALCASAGIRTDPAGPLPTIDAEDIPF